MKATGRWIGALVSIVDWFCAFAIIAMMIQIVLDVVLRNMFNFGLPGTTVLVTNYWMVAVSYLPLALTEKLNGHITVDMAVTTLSRRARFWLAVAAYIVSFAVVVVLAYRSFGEAMESLTHGTFVMELSTAVPIWPAYFFLPIGFTLYALVLLYRVAVMVTGAESGLGELPPDIGEEVAEAEKV